MSDRKIINDPVFGFINIPKGLLYDIVCHPLLQRLTRIKQLGLSSAVYPGAQHTRFQHSLGAFHLMSETIKHLTAKGNFIFDSEAEAVQAAILLHDIGHGPFSHVLENTLAGGVSHEEISLMLMEQMNKDMKGQLNLAIQVFKDEYPKKFLHKLVSGQLDMDRKYFASFLLIFSLLLILERISSFRAFVMEEEVTSTLNSFLLIIPRLRVDNTTSL